MDFNKKEFLDHLNLLWGQLFTYNHVLLKRSEDEKQFGQESFTDIIDFYLTSQAQCFIKDILLQHYGSPGMLLTARCFLEGLALKRMYQRGKISDAQVELLRHQVNIIEYNYYKDFEDIADKILLPQKLVNDNDNARKYFQERLSGQYTEKQIQQFFKSNNPFLCDAHVNNRQLVGEYLGEDYAKLYGLYSQAIHPSVNDFYSNEALWQTLYDVLLLIIDEYKSLPRAEFSFGDFQQNVYASDIARKYEELIRKEYNVLIDVSKVFEQFFNKNYTSDTLNSLSLLMGEMCTDKLLGLCEQVKSKWKIILDMFASFFECYIESIPREERFNLLKEHEQIQLSRNIGQEFSTDYAYSIYKSLYPNGAEKDRFEKGFLTLGGYTVDENAIPQKLTHLVKKFIKRFSNSDAKISWDRCFLLDYMESQMLSHANGYMWFANSGAWGDVNNVIIGTDSCLLFILEAMLSAFKIHKETDETKKYKTIINILRNSIKRIRTLLGEKVLLLKTPGIVL